MRYGFAGPRPMMWNGYGIVEVVGSVVFWFLLILLVVSFIRWIGREHRDSFSIAGKGDNALGILKERYAKGEITKKEFEEMKKDIS